MCRAILVITAQVSSLHWRSVSLLADGGFLVQQNFLETSHAKGEQNAAGAT